MPITKKINVPPLCVALCCLALSACGGGGGGDDPSAYKVTTAAAGSTVVSAETAASNATIQYAQYQSTPSFNWSIPVLAATVNFNAGTKAGSIQFPLAGGTETVSTSDAYANVSWSGPLNAGAYRFNGNILMGCDPKATPLEATQLFVSSSLERLQEAQPLDALHGITFDVFDCALMQQSKVDTLKINADGSFTLSTTPTVATQDQLINMLNPEKWGGALIDSVAYGGHAFRYGSNGVNKFAIVLKRRTLTASGASVFHHLLAIQR